jgi:hypothetical protein
MAILARDCPFTVMTADAAGDGSPGSAAIVDIPSPQTTLLVDLTSTGIQGVKLSEGNVGDQIDLFILGRPDSGVNSHYKLRIFDHENNSIVQSDEVNAYAAGDMVRLKKILPEPYSRSGFTTPVVGTWVGYSVQVRFSYPSS